MIASFLLGVLVMAVALTTSATTHRGGRPPLLVRVSAHAEIDLGITLATAACAIGFGLRARLPLPVLRRDGHRASACSA